MTMLSFSFAGGLLVALLVLMVVVALPLKVGAHFADAKRKGLFWCALTALVGLLAGHLASVLFGGAIGGPLAAAIGFVIAIRYMLGTNLAGAIGLTFIALAVCILGIWALAYFGVVHAEGTPGVTDITVVQQPRKAGVNDRVIAARWLPAELPQDGGSPG
jgi:hypothetical protein